MNNNLINNSIKKQDFRSMTDTVCIVTQLCPTFCTPWTVARQAPLCMGFFRQEYCVGSHALLQGSSRPRDQTQVSHIAGRFFTIWATREWHQWQTLSSPKSWCISNRNSALYFNIRLYDLGRLQITWNTMISYINKLKAQASLENASVLKCWVRERAGFVVGKTDIQRLE